jgi:hypothetical protein
LYVKFPTKEAEGVVFAINFFHSLFLSMCVRLSSESSSSFSIIPTAMIMTLDLLHIVYKVIQVHKKLKKIVQLLQTKCIVLDPTMDLLSQLSRLERLQTARMTPSTSSSSSITATGTKENSISSIQSLDNLAPVLEEFLPVFHQLKYIILMEYVEAFIPFVYGTYSMSLLFLNYVTI